MEEEVLVTWETTGGAVPAVTLEYQVNAGPWQEIEGDVENTGSYVWRDLPSVSSPTYRVQVRDAGGTGASDESDGVFTIFACSEDLVGDLTGDCYVDGRDLAVLAGQWLTGGNPFDPDWPAGP